MVSEWIDAHPARGNPDAAMWIGANGQPISYHYYRKTVRHYFERSGLKKPSSPYIYRYSRITLLANDVHLAKLTRAQFAYCVGWSASSRLIDHYLRTDQTDAFRVFASNLQDEKTKTELISGETIALMLAVLSDPKVQASAEQALKHMPDAAARWRSIVDRTVDADSLNAELERQAQDARELCQKTSAGGASPLLVCYPALLNARKCHIWHEC